jgi:septum formation protein
MRLARAKAAAASAALRQRAIRPVLAADTAVVLGDRIFGKPVDEAHGVAMLMALGGRTHEVLTAVVVQLDGRVQGALQCSRVTFRELGADECRRYWATGEPADKAGAYAIQGGGAVFVERLDGSFSGVMGLPLFETAALLDAVGVLRWQADA